MKKSQEGKKEKKGHELMDQFELITNTLQIKKRWYLAMQIHLLGFICSDRAGCPGLAL